MRYSKAEYAKILAAQQEVCRAEEDYERLRTAYLDAARSEPGHEVALAMIGADMDRAHAHLQLLIGSLRMPLIRADEVAEQVNEAYAQQPEEESA